MSGAVTVAVFYGLTGRWDLPWLWVTAAVSFLLSGVMVLKIDRDLVRERRRPGPGGVDRMTQWVLAAVMLAEIVIACLDVGRFHWSDAVPAGVHWAGLVLFGAGYGMVMWSVAVNRFFSAVVRVQTDRGHAIVRAGPYRHLRHPGYLGMLMSYPVIALAIGSWWGFAAGALCFPIVLRRALLEDAYLLEHMPGYRQYATEVRYRLIPGVW